MVAGAVTACTRDDSDREQPAPTPGGAARPPVDDYGDTIALTAAPATRIVSLNPTTTEILFALGAGPRLVGRTHWDLWPDSARAVPDLGDGIDPNVEAVLSARPDVVVLYAGAGNRAAAARLRAAGVRTIALKVDRIADFERAVTLLGVIAGDTARATVVRDSVARTLARVRSATRDRPPIAVFWHVWDAPLITIGRGSYLSELVEIAGGRNIYDSLPAPSPQVAIEDLVRRDPEVILAGPVGARRIARDPRWRPLGAVRNGRVLVVDTNLVGRPSVRLGEAAVSLANLLHPGALP